MVYDAYEGCRFGDLGGVVYLEEWGGPKVDGVYDAAGNRLGDNLADAAEEARGGWGWAPDCCALSAKAFKQLKEHKS